MAFKLTKQSGADLSTPESLLTDIKSKKIRGPLASQADVWREYQKTHLSDSDVALNLPTGGGKTLVGLMLLEWRRRKYGEKVLYLCPTVQLVNQVVDQAVKSYGMDVCGFVKKKSDYDRADLLSYESSNKIAITTYSALFNVSPAFKDPDIIVLDDSHAAENYIIKMWSLVITKTDAVAFQILTGILSRYLSVADVHNLLGDNTIVTGGNWIDMIPAPVLYEIHSEITTNFDTIFGAQGAKPDHKFAWQKMRNNLLACQIYLSPGRVEIRPYLPPTNTHRPFCDAKQRIYMSATPGQGGELERIVGRKHITRIDAKSGWDKQTIGRRLFFFPNFSLDEDESNEMIKSAIAYAKRAVIITSDTKTAESYQKDLAILDGAELFEARDLEETKDKFVNAEKAIAVLANRYDGIDFPNNECRLIVLEGLPSGSSLQDKFLISRMNLLNVYKGRLHTRLTQAFGRCTRNDGDYSAIIVHGNELTRYLFNLENQSFLHPEIQAEIQFGITESEGITIDGFLENLETFYSQSDDWEMANGEIITRRSTLSQSEIFGSSVLSGIASNEIGYSVSLWNGDYLTALSECKSIIGKLTDQNLQGYRTFWNYLAGCASWMCWKNGNIGSDSEARQFFSSALKSAAMVSWYLPLHRYCQGSIESKQPQKLLSALNIESIEAMIIKYGTLNDRKYDKEELEVISGIKSSKSEQFENAHAKLGGFLGFVYGNINENASPDPFWYAGDSFCIVFEDYSGAEDHQSLSPTKARQAFTHNNWIKDNIKSLKPDATIIRVIISPVTKCDAGALPHLHDVYHWRLNDFIAWSMDVLSQIRKARSEIKTANLANWRSDLLIALEKKFATPETFLSNSMIKNAYEYFTGKPRSES